VAYVALFFALSGTAVAAKPMITGADIENGSITDADIAAANKDGTATTPSLRTLGTGAQQAAAGDDSRLSDARTPTGAAGGGLTGDYPNPGIGDGAVGTPAFSNTIPAVRATSAEFQIVPNLTDTTVNFAGEAYDTADLHSTSSNTSRLTAPVAGVYRISANVIWNVDPNGIREIQVRVNGGGGPLDDTPAPVITQQLSTDVNLAAGGYVEVVAKQTSGGPATLRGTYFTMSWVAPG
jgi:hypothetical protein